MVVKQLRGFLCCSAAKESACNGGDLGLTPGLGRSPGEGTVHPLQYSGLENSMYCTVHGIAESDTTKRLSLSLFHFLSTKAQEFFLDPKYGMPTSYSLPIVLPSTVLSFLRITQQRGSKWSAPCLAPDTIYPYRPFLSFLKRMVSVWFDLYKTF